MPNQPDLPTGWTIRRAMNKDAPAIQQLVAAILQEYGLPSDPGHADRGFLNIEDYYRAGFLNMVFDEHKKLVATFGLWPRSPHCVDLVKMFARPEVRGQGLGQALLTYSIKKAKQMGFKTIYLETASQLVEAKALYKKFGFEQLPATPEVSRCDIAMSLTL
ncbi:MAG: GNAT family N-acetyltransferase [bacterium]